MIINLNKLMDVKKMTVDLTDGRPFLYFLFQKYSFIEIQGTFSFDFD